MIAVSSAHRRESIAATEFAINELKRTVPIWKKVGLVSSSHLIKSQEIYEDCDAVWKKNTEQDSTECL
jgi:molybdopterin synthase catalytic subunit